MPLQNGSPLSPGTNPNAQSDFDLYKTQTSMVIRLNSRTRFQLGWADTVAGRNTGRGSTLLISLWRNF